MVDGATVLAHYAAGSIVNGFEDDSTSSRNRTTRCQRKPPAKSIWEQKGFGSIRDWTLAGVGENDSWRLLDFAGVGHRS